MPQVSNHHTSEERLLMLFISLDSNRHRGGKRVTLVLKPANSMNYSSDNVLETDMQFKERKQNSSSYRNAKIVRNASLFRNPF